MKLKQYILIIVLIIIGGEIYRINQQLLNLGEITPLPMSVVFAVSLIIVTDSILKIWIYGEERLKTSDTDGKNINFIGRNILGLISMGIFFFYIIDSTNTSIIKWYWLSSLTIALSFHSFMEWKYLRESKEYVTTILLIPINFFIILFF